MNQKRTYILAEADKSDIDSQADNADIDSQEDNTDVNTDVNTNVNTDVNVNVDASKQYQNQDGMCRPNTVSHLLCLHQCCCCLIFYAYIGNHCQIQQR
jgi:hypothetical protein